MLLEGNSARSPRPRRTAADRVRKALAELHGGKLRLDKLESGRSGTTFVLTLPVAGTGS